MSTASSIGMIGAANSFWLRRIPAAPAPLALAIGCGCVAALSQYAGSAEAEFGATLAMLGATVMTAGALLRRAFADTHPGEPGFRAGPLGLQWDAQEWRIIGVGVLAVLVLSAAMAAPIGIVLAASTWMVVGGNDDLANVGMFVMMGGFLLALMACAYAAVRLLPCLPATVDRQGIELGWKLTRGRVRPLIVPTFGVAGEIALIVLVSRAAADAFLPPTGVEMNGRGDALAQGLSHALALIALPLPIGLGVNAYQALRAT